MTSRLLAVQPDAVLCRLAARGNAQAFDALYQRYRQPVFAFVFHLLGRGGGAEDAEDITQETFAKAFAGISAKHEEGSFKAWLYTIARNRTLDSLRASGRSSEVSLDTDEAAEPVMPPEGETAARAEERAQLGWLVAAVGELPERQREALLLREFGGMSHSEIAGELGTTVSATKKLIGRGREQVAASASLNGYRSRRLGRDLAMAAPVLPIAAAGIGMSLAGGGAAAATAGGGLIGGKAAATMLAVVAIGGAAAAEQDHAKKQRENQPKQERSERSVAATAGSESANAPEQVAFVEPEGPRDRQATDDDDRRDEFETRGRSERDREDGREDDRRGRRGDEREDRLEEESGGRRRSGGSVETKPARDHHGGKGGKEDQPDDVEPDRDRSGPGGEQPEDDSGHSGHD